MPIKHSFSILLCNFKLVAKLFVFLMIIVLLASAILIGILDPVLKDFFDDVRDELHLDADEFVQHPILSMQKFFKHFSDFLAANSSMVWTKIIYIWLLIMGSRFLISLPLLPVTKILHSKMTTGFDMGLANATVSTFGQNLLFCLVTSIILSTFDILLFVGIAYLVSALFKLIGIIALPICVLILALIYTARMAVVCQWLPHIAAQQSKNIFVAFKNSLKPTFKNFRKNFICLFVVTVCTVTIALVTLIPTIGLFPMLLMPTFMVIYAAMCLALNYSYYEQKYFIDNGITVYNPTKKYEA